jgi:putative flippase GtrA
VSAWLRSAPGAGLRLGTSLRFVRFCIVGASGVLVNLLVLWLAREYLFATLSPPRLRLNAALALAIAVATLSNFLWNRFWTWRDRHRGAGARALAGQFGQYAVAVLIGSGVQFLLTNLLSTYMHYLLANLVAIAAAAGVNFALNNLWTFRHRSAPPSGSS